MPKTVYECPEYYEIAFSFRDISAEVDVFERCCEMSSPLSVRKVLEIGCGNSPHMKELLKRGYEYTGLDNSEAMADYSRSRASAIEGKASIILGDMLEFSLPETYDFAFITLGSLYARSTADIISHLGSIASALNGGGLYLMDWCVHFSPISDLQNTWTMESGVKRVIFPQEFLRIIEQTGNLEFIGWWNNWNLSEPLSEIKDSKSIGRPIVLLRRK